MRKNNTLMMLGAILVLVSCQEKVSTDVVETMQAKYSVIVYE